MIDIRTGVIKLADLGGAMYIGERAVTYHNYTWVYQPPEFTTNQVKVYPGAPGDVWAVGCVIYE